MGQDQVSGGVSALCWLAAPVAMFYGNLKNSVIRSKSVLKSSSVIDSQIGVMSDQLRVSLICSVLRASKFSVLKLIEIVISWVYYTIPFGFSFFRHFWGIIFQLL